MKTLLPALSLLAAALLAGPAQADETVWHFYGADEGGGSLAALEKSEIDSPEPHWPFAMSCYSGADWSIIISGIDRKALGETIAAGEVVQVSILVDGKEDALGSFFPEISFGEMFGEWEYTLPLDLDMLQVLSEAGTLAVKGTGVDLTLPPGGKEAIAGLADACANLE